MTTCRTRFAAASLGLLGAMTLAGCWGNTSEDPPIHLQQNMDFQARGDAQEANGFFDDHRYMRKPPEGTVAVGFLHGDDHLYEGRYLDGTLANTLPDGIELDEALLARGQERYGIYCSPCHGVTGHGDGLVTRRGGGLATVPANLHAKSLQPAPLGYYFRVITHGKGQMQPYAAQIQPEDRWAIAAWVRVLQVSHRAKESDVPPEARTKTARRVP